MTGTLSPLHRRFLVIWLPYLTCERLVPAPSSGSRPSADDAREPPGELPDAFAVVARVRGMLRVSAVSAAAELAGIIPGLSLTDARARLPELGVVAEDRVADDAFLEAIADWADRYTPLVAIAAPPFGEEDHPPQKSRLQGRLTFHDPKGPEDSGAFGNELILDITGASSLFGGEAAMLADVRRRLEARGLTVRTAIASTVGAAHAAAHFAPDQVVPHGEEATLIAPMPLAALRIGAAMAATLARLGLETVGDLLGRPRAPLTARFGPTLLTALDLALGRAEEPITPRRYSAPLVAERAFAEPLFGTAPVEAVTRSLAETLTATLSERGEGIRTAELALYHADGHVTRAVAGTSAPVNDGRFLCSLFNERFARLGSAGQASRGIETEAGFDLIRLSVLESQRIAPEQGDLAAPVNAAGELAHLVDRLGARLGLGAVQHAVPQDAHLPERAFLYVPAATVKPRALSFAGEATPLPGAPQDRPVRLLTPAEPVEAVADVPDGPPRRFRWRRALHDVVRAEGPERIAVPWWEEGDRPADEAATTRDYFRVEDANGLRFWLYRQGLYEREGHRPPPRWYLQGLFG